ncbi:MAG TPA: aldo/keto reductase [Planctomycetota bacterium]|nr:aldo/keto reductase [Planctomycetota bacterium]
MSEDFQSDQNPEESKECGSCGIERRRFIALLAEAGLTGALLALLGRAGRADDKPARQKPMQFRMLGRTREKVSIVGLGGYHMGMQQDEQESIRIVRTAVDGGINFLDNCWDYNEGQSEIRMGKALRDGYRRKVFLMTKIDGRDRKTAAQQIDESLKRLQTDMIDLIQMHEVIRLNEPERIFAEDGGMQALIDARKAGKTRYIGFTGHKSPDIHLKTLDVAAKHGFRFDAVQMPLNVLDAHFDSFESKVLPRLVKEEIGVLGMKPMGGGEFMKRKAPVSARECLMYALSLPTSTVITGCENVRDVEQALDAGRNFKPLREKEIAALLEKTRETARDGRMELYKTTGHFDGTSQNPEWLGKA